MMEPADLKNTAASSTAPGSISADGKPTLVRGLGLLDSVLLLVSGIIGSSIFLTAKDIAGPLPQPMLFLLVWVLGAVISLCGCVAFRRVGIDVPRLRRAVHLSARGLWRSDRRFFMAGCCSAWPTAVRYRRTIGSAAAYVGQCFRSFRRST
jgi:hypothetical protein